MQRLVCSGVLLLATLTRCAVAQSDVFPGDFEVASVKPNRTSESESGDFQHGRLAIRSAPLRHLIAAAYNLRVDLVIGGADWVDSDRFDIQAKADAATSEAASRLMLRKLLADRFKLTVHSENRPSPVFVLSVAKNGPKLVESAADSTERPRCFGSGPVTCYKRNMKQLADILRRISSGIDLPVVDETGLTGLYDFTLTFSPPEPADSGTSVFQESTTADQ
jgi:uncharacterized protein (TIGR03435 family)